MRFGASVGSALGADDLLATDYPRALSVRARRLFLSLRLAAEHFVNIGKLQEKARLLVIGQDLLSLFGWVAVERWGQD